MSEGKGTIGQRINKMVEQYKRIFDNFVEWEMMGGDLEKIKGAALMDIWFQKYVAEEAHKQVKQYIDDRIRFINSQKENKNDE